MKATQLPITARITIPECYVGYGPTQATVLCGQITKLAGGSTSAPMQVGAWVDPEAGLFVENVAVYTFHWTNERDAECSTLLSKLVQHLLDEGEQAVLVERIDEQGRVVELYSED